MFLKSLTIKNLKKFKEKTLMFSDDITVVKGKNEEGKSTIVEAIVAGLFFRPNAPSGTKKIEELKSWIQDELFTINMEFEEAGESYRLVKDFENKKEAFTAKEKSADADKTMDDFLFFRKEDQFRKFAVIRARDILIESKEKGEIKKVFQGIISGSDVAPDDIVKKVDKKIKGASGSAAYPGLEKELKGAEAEMAELLRLKREKEQHLAKSQEWRSSLVSKLEEREGVIKKITDLDAIHRELLAYVETREKAEAQEKMVAEQEKIKNLTQEKMKEKKRLEEEVHAMAFLEHEDVEKMRHNFREFEYEQKRIDELNREIEQLRSSKERAASSLAPVAAAVAVLFAVGCIGFFAHWAFFFAWVPAAGLIVYRVLSGPSSKNDTIRKKVAELKTAETKQAESARHLVPIVKAMGAQVTEKEFEEMLRDYAVARSQLTKTEHDLAQLLKDKTAEEVKRNYEQLVADTERKKIFLRDMEQKLNLKEQNIRNVERERSDFSQKERALSGEITRLETQLEQKGATGEELGKIDERIAYLSGKKSRAERYLKVLVAMKEMLAEAQIRSQQKIRDIFKERIERYLFEITGGKYDRIRFEDDLTLLVHSKEKGDWVLPEEHLSMGAIDQIYFVARAAFLKILGEGKRTILLLDDPFLTFDGDRRKKTKNILEDMTENFQIIFFTCSDNYDDWGNVITL